MFFGELPLFRSTYACNRNSQKSIKSAPAKNVIVPQRQPVTESWVGRVRN